MNKEDRSTWVTKDQLDTPLCDVFEGTKTNGTVREWVRMSEIILGLSWAELENMGYKEMNRYIDSLDRKLQKLSN